MEFLAGCSGEEPKEGKEQDESRRNKHEKIKKDETEHLQASQPLVNTLARPTPACDHCTLSLVLIEFCF